MRKIEDIAIELRRVEQSREHFYLKYAEAGQRCDELRKEMESAVDAEIERRQEAIE